MRHLYQVILILTPILISAIALLAASPCLNIVIIKDLVLRIFEITIGLNLIWRPVMLVLHKLLEQIWLSPVICERIIEHGLIAFAKDVSVFI